MIFKVSTGLGVIAFLTVLLVVSKDKLANKARVLEDLLGGMLFIPAVVGLLLGITHSAKHGLFEATSLAWFAGSAACLGAWIWRELSVENPLLDVRLLARPEIARPNVMMVFVALGVYQGGHLMSLFGQQPLSTGIGLGLSATMAGFLLMPANILAGIAAPFIGVAVGRYGPRNMARLGCLMMFSAFALLIVFHGSVAVVLSLMILQGVGLGIVYVTTPIVIVNASPPDRTSESSGMMAVIRSTAMAIGAQTVATLLAAGSAHHGEAGRHAFPDAAAYQTAFIYVAATAFVALLICQKLPKKLTLTSHIHV
jgi:predicted MFS family arabinose efflux permease